MLDLFRAPGAGGRLHLGIIGEDVAEICGVVAAVALDQARRLGNGEQVGVDLGRLEPFPGNVVEGPA